MRGAYFRQEQLKRILTPALVERWVDAAMRGDHGTQASTLPPRTMRVGHQVCRDVCVYKVVMISTCCRGWGGGWGVSLAVIRNLGPKQQ